MESSVVIQRINNLEYSFQKSTKKGIRSVCNALTFKNPNLFAYSNKIQKFNRNNLTFRIGMLKTLTAYLKKNGVKYDLYDYHYESPNITIDDRLQGKYIHQHDAVKAFYKRRFGIIVVPTRGGKTFIASEILRLFLENDVGNFLFIVDNTTLFTQAVDDIKKFFERYGGIQIGEIREGVVDVSSRVTVAMIQTIQLNLSNRCKNKEKQKALKKYLKELKFLVVDEIHDNCSDSKLRIYKSCKSLEYQLCLSATPYRSGQFTQNLKLKEWSGDVIYEITEDELRRRGVLSDYKVFLMLIDHNNMDYDDINDDEYADVRNKLIFENQFRNNILRVMIEELIKLNLKTLVLFQSVEHGQRMSELMNITFISGRSNAKIREQAKTEFLNKEGGVLMASNIFKKGITLPEVEVIINADEGVEDANTIQRKGRVLGATDNKTRSLVIDFFDFYDFYFSEHSNARLNTYVKSIGEERIGIIDTSHSRWCETFVKWVKKWFIIDE